MSDTGLELLNKIFLSAGEGIIIVNEEGLITLSNKRAEELFKYDSGELTGKVIEDLIPQKYREKHVGYRKNYIKRPVSRPMGSGLDLVGLKKNGETFPLEISLGYVTHEDSTLVVAFITDITARKEQENALLESRKKLEGHANELESKVKDRTRELEHLNLGLKIQIRERKLAEKALKESLEEINKAKQNVLKSLSKEKELNEMKSRFISMASHEFRTPLTTILSSANLIGKYTEGGQQENREKHIQRIKTSVQNLTNILNDFLSLEKLESGAIKRQTELFRIEQLLDEIRGEFEHTLRQGQVLKIVTEDKLPDIISDPHIIKNTLINLVSNAVKYSPEGKPIIIEAFRKGNNITIIVEDEGIGIPKKEQKNLFRRFFRAENVTNIQGTGLGLNIVKRYLDLIEGNITFSSEEGKGSKFIITFPVKI